MIVWLSHAFWYTLIAVFVVSLAWALLRLVWSICCSVVLIVVSLPAATRVWRARRRAARASL